MSWLKWNCGLTRKREILIMASTLSMRPVYVAAHFMLVMEWADGETDTGEIAGLPVSVLDEYAQCSGFGQALVSVGWVEVYEGGFRFVNYERHNGTSTKKRLAAASRQNRKRDRETALQESHPKRDKSHTTSVTKRREEKNNPPTPADAGLVRELGKEPWTVTPKRAAELVATHGPAVVRHAMTLAAKGREPGGLLMHILRDGIDPRDIPKPEPPPIEFASAGERNRAIREFKAANPCAALWSDSDTVKSKMFAEWHEGSRTQPTNDAR